MISSWSSWCQVLPLQALPAPSYFERGGELSAISEPTLPLSPVGLICADVTTKLLHCSLSASRYLPLKQLAGSEKRQGVKRKDDCEVKSPEGVAAK